MLDNAWPYGTIDSLIKNFYEINSIKKTSSNVLFKLLFKLYFPKFWNQNYDVN